MNVEWMSNECRMNVERRCWNMSIKTIASIGLCLVPVAYKLLEKYLEKREGFDRVWCNSSQCVPWAEHIARENKWKTADSGTESNQNIHCLCGEWFDIIVSERGKRKSRKERRSEYGSFDNDCRSGVQHNYHNCREQIKLNRTYKKQIYIKRRKEKCLQ